MASIKDYLNVSDPNFINEYKNRTIYDDASKKFYSIQNGVLAETAPIQGSNYDFFSASQGLAPAGSGSYKNTDAWRYKAVAPSAENSWLGMGSAGDPRIIANGGQPIKSGFDITPGQASQAQIDAYNAKTGDYAKRVDDPTFNIATTGRSAVVAPPAGATLISGPSGLKGLTESQIWREPGTGKIYKLPEATLTSPTGEKKVVVVGSQEASNLLNNNWTLGNKVGGGTITPDSFTGGNKINPPTGGNQNISDADTAAASAKSTLDSYLELMKQKDTTDKKAYDDVLAKYIASLTTDVSKESLQTTANDKFGISGKETELANANSDLKMKLAEIDALDKSYQNSKLATEGKVISLSRMQGQINQADREYAMKKNLLASDASLLQAKFLGLQGQLEAAQKAADRSVDLKYADQVFKTNQQLALLGVLKGQVDEETEDYRWAVEQTLTDQRNALNQKMDYEKMDYAQKLQDISKYGLTGVTVNSTMAQIQAAKVKSPKWIEENKPSGTGTGTASDYFTAPKADGTLGYYFGNPKNIGSAQVISKETFDLAAKAGKDDGTVYDDNYIARQTAQFIGQDGSVDWDGINTLQNVDKALWQKVANAANNYLNEAEKPVETTTQPTENKPIFGSNEAGQNWKNIGRTVKESYSNFFGNLFGG